MLTARYTRSLPQLGLAGFLIGATFVWRVCTVRVDPSLYSMSQCV
jgi:hypothetical protein